MGGGLVVYMLGKVDGVHVVGVEVVGDDGWWEGFPHGGVVEVEFCA